MHHRPPLISANRPPPQDFLSQGTVWHPSRFPWFQVNVKVLDQNCPDHFHDQILMVSTYDRLKEILGQESKVFRIRSIDYVTPGYMNGSGQWQFEPLVEITDMSNDGGWSIPRCKVAEKRIYRGLSLEPVPEFWDERVVYRQTTLRKKKSNRI
ncbi:hypothetical protein SAMN05444062_1075 [Pseudomonas syringae]|nr:hypothetical protein CCL15_20875 [Pseudomonas syringae]SFH52434.1 hypothetical protein SAMN05444062_1075 [Pseudomonas syringae]